MATIVSEITTSNIYKDIEFCCVDIMLNRDKFCVILFYHPPHNTLADEQYLDLSLCCLSSLMHNTGSHVILMGDFNLPNVDWIHYSTPANRFYDK